MFVFFKFILSEKGPFISVTHLPYMLHIVLYFFKQCIFPDLYRIIVYFELFKRINSTFGLLWPTCLLSIFVDAKLASRANQADKNLGLMRIFLRMIKLSFLFQQAE